MWDLLVIQSKRLELRAIVAVLLTFCWHCHQPTTTQMWQVTCLAPSCFLQCVVDGKMEAAVASKEQTNHILVTDDDYMIVVYRFSVQSVYLTYGGNKYHRLQIWIDIWSFEHIINRMYLLILFLMFIYSPKNEHPIILGFPFSESHCTSACAVIDFKKWHSCITVLLFRTVWLLGGCSVRSIRHCWNITGKPNRSRALSSPEYRLSWLSST